MRINKIEVFQINLKGRRGGQHLAGGRVFSDLDSTVVKISTDTEIIGWGESVPWGSNYLPAFSLGVRAGLKELAPSLIGQDPLQIGRIIEVMDSTLYGHPYVKTAIDMACWDILGKFTNLPLYTLLGGKMSERPYITAHIGHESQDWWREEMLYFRECGCKQFVIKANGKPELDIAFIKKVAGHMLSDESLKIDANGAWRLDEALRVARGVGRDIDIYFEQPCATYEECRDLRRVSNIPIVLDECLSGLDTIIRAHEDGVLDAVSIKLGRNGGIWKSKIIRDFCAAINVPMHIQDTGASDIGNAAITHFAYSVPSRVLLYVWDARNLIETETANGGAKCIDARMEVTHNPGLGVEPIDKVLGEPVAVY
jgi:L-alanine-DL-glutamate epimerase-like enolase superfamily enzyme